MMGRLPTRNRAAVPRLATSLKEMRVTSISAGYAHSVAVTDEGRAFSSGQNDRGQVPDKPPTFPLQLYVP